MHDCNHFTIYGLKYVLSPCLNLTQLIIDMKNILFSAFIITAAIIAIRNGNTATVYQWTDNDGIVHFSDAAPTQDGITETREINFDSFENTSPGQQTLSIIEQANIMAEWRKQDEAQRLVLKQMQLEQQRLMQDIELDRQESLNRNPGYYPDQPHYFVFPQVVDYRYRERWYNRPGQQQFSGTRMHKTPPPSRQYTSQENGSTRGGFGPR